MQKSKLEEMQKEFKEKGLDFNRFLGTDENIRKRILKDDYGETKTKYGWLYDQPIVAEEATTAAATAEVKEQAALDKKAEKLAEKESEEEEKEFTRTTASRKRF